MFSGGGPEEYLKEALEEQQRKKQQHEKHKAEKEQKKAQSSSVPQKRDEEVGTTSTSPSPATSSIRFVSKWKTLSKFFVSEFDETEEDGHPHVRRLQEKAAKAAAAARNDGKSIASSTASSVTSSRRPPEDEAGDGDDDDDDEEDDPGADNEEKPDRNVPEDVDLLYVRRMEEEASLPGGSGTLFLGEECGQCCWTCSFFSTHYHVRLNLKKSYAKQSQFLKRVCSVFILEYFCTLLWMFLATRVPQIRRQVVDKYSMAYIPLAMFMVAKIVIRSLASKMKRLYRPWVVILAIIIRNACITYYCGAVSAYFSTDILILVCFLVWMSYVFLTLSSHFMKYDVSHVEILGMGGFVQIVFSLLVIPGLILSKTGWTVGHGSHLYGIMVETWLPAAFASQILIMLLMYDLKQVMSGWRYPLGEKDWLFTALYL